MQSIIITGANASGRICPPDGLAVEIRNIQIDIPINEVGTTDPTVTLSGRYSGATKFHSDVDLTKMYGYNECVHIFSTLDTDEYSAVINYLLVGDMGCNPRPLPGMRDNYVPQPRRLL